MHTKQLVSLILIVPFLALTAYSLAQVGYVGLFAFQLTSPAGWQVLADLVIALLLVLLWLVPEARRSGRNPWIWVVLTCFLGSIGPLLYLVTDKREG